MERRGTWRQCVKETHTNGGRDLSKMLKLVGHTALRHSLELINNIITEVTIEENMMAAGRPHKLVYTKNLKQCNKNKNS